MFKRSKIMLLSVVSIVSVGLFTGVANAANPVLWDTSQGPSVNVIAPSSGGPYTVDVKCPDGTTADPASFVLNAGESKVVSALLSKDSPICEISMIGECPELTGNPDGEMLAIGGFDYRQTAQFSCLKVVDSPLLGSTATTVIVALLLSAGIAFVVNRRKIQSVA